ncbi:uncharacterized protein LOC125682176 [Ostrea edulis]|uniref:uncharacterized protein LOC125682176 n=1 Tax=Ostrea edulis TaxID=37623 RepID=UPI0024AF83F2|nr:uncharacterized protein LOC125682176 [Ostrea edulis]
MLLCCILLCLIPFTACTCTFPLSSGSWTDSEYGTVQFSGSIMFMSQKGFGTGDTSTNWTCDTVSGSNYLARTVTTVSLTYGAIGTLQLYLYICMDITMVTQYSYYYYQQTEDSVDLGRMKGSVSATYGVSDVCTTTIPVGLFQVLVKQGSEGSAMATCPSPVLGSFTYTYYDGSTACGTDSDWDGCSDSSRISLNYTLCNKVVLYSVGGNLGCVVNIQSGSDYYVGLYNFDTTVDGAATRRYICLVISSGTYVNISQSPDHCQASQSAHVIPASGALLSLSQTASCVATSATPADSDNTLVIVLPILLILFVIYLVVVIFLYCYRKIYWRRRLERKPIIIPRELPTGGHELLAESETTTDVNSAIRREGTHVPVLDGGGQPQTRLMEERMKRVIPIPNTTSRSQPRFHVNKKVPRIDKVQSYRDNEMHKVSRVYSRNVSPHNQYRPTIVSRQSFMSRAKTSHGGSNQTLTNGSLYSETLPNMRSTSSIKLSMYSLFSKQEAKSPLSSGFGSEDDRTISPDPEIQNPVRSKTVSRASRATYNKVLPASRDQNTRVEPQVLSLYNFVMAEG